MRLTCTVSDGGIPPQYMTEYASGMDVFSPIDIIIPAKESVLIPTKLSFLIPDDVEIQIRGRSGLAIKHQIVITHGVGTVDSDYTDELYVPLTNIGNKDFEIKTGMRIAQLVVSPVIRPNLKIFIFGEEAGKNYICVDVKKRRGGFGSTGI